VKFPFFTPRVLLKKNWTHKNLLPTPPHSRDADSGYVGIHTYNKQNHLLNQPVIYGAVTNLVAEQFPTPRKSKGFNSYSFLQPVLNSEGLNTRINQELIQEITLLGLETRNLMSSVINLSGIGFKNQELGSTNLELPIAELIQSETSRDLLGSYSATRRYEIRKASKSEGLKVRIQCLTNTAIENPYRDILDIHSTSRNRTSRSGTPDLKFWTALTNSIQKESGTDYEGGDILATVTFEGKLLAVCVSHFFNKQAYYWMNASEKEGHKFFANQIALHATLIAAIYRGVKYFELGRHSQETQKELSLQNYKLQFGSELINVPNFVLKK
jgi:hypothetical protein